MCARECRVCTSERMCGVGRASSVCTRSVRVCAQCARVTQRRGSPGRESGAKGQVGADSDLPSRPLLLVARVFIEEAHPLTHRPIDTVGSPRPGGPWGEVGGGSQRRRGSRIRRGGASSQGTYTCWEAPAPRGRPRARKRLPAPAPGPAVPSAT